LITRVSLFPEFVAACPGRAASPLAAVIIARVNDLSIGQSMEDCGEWLGGKLALAQEFVSPDGLERKLNSPGAEGLCFETF
jgi:hypothetical protein